MNQRFTPCHFASATYPAEARCRMSDAAPGKNLKRRVLTAVCLIPSALAAIVYLPIPALALLFGAVAALGAAEWARLAGFESLAGRYGYVIVFVALLLGIYPFTAAWPPLLWLALAWWVVALALVVATLRGMALPALGRGAKAVIGLLVLVPTWGALLLLQRQHGAVAVIWLMLLVWGADSAAYFAGRRWGRRRLAPSISPGKTWEGLAGALAATLCCALIAALATHMAYRDAVSFTLLSVVTVMASVLGDLVESLFKRQAGLKDSGSLLPGHGGVLDRIDSLTAAAPVFALGLAVLEVAL